MSQRVKAEDRGEDPYRSHGYFGPFDARRILKRFEEQGVRFQIADASGVERWDSKFPRYALMRTVPARVMRSNRVEIFVHLADAEKAQKIIDET
jgi:hypothetical protein